MSAGGPYELPATVPPPHAALRFSIGIPAHNEEDEIARTLASIAAQRDARGVALPDGVVETIVFANGCSDGTAARARRAAAESGSIVHVVEGTLPPDAAHVGTARRAVMEAASARLALAGRPRQIVATTDADTVVHPCWVAETERALEGADAVGGRIYVDAATMRALPPALACAIETEERYRFAVARAEASCDPQPHDPWPRHGQQFGASFAVRADVYRDVGGLPPRAALEDVALYGALLRHDARFCHSLRVRVTTSPRLDARAAGGFGTHIAELGELYARGVSQAVEVPALTIGRIHGRAVFRAWWTNGADAVDRDDRRVAAAVFAATEDEVSAEIASSRTFGAAFETLEGRAGERGAFARASVPIAAATAALEAFARDRRRVVAHA